MLPNLLTCPDCGKERPVIAMPTHLTAHKWSQAAIESFIARGSCRKAKSPEAPVPPSRRSAAHASTLSFANEQDASRLRRCKRKSGAWATRRGNARSGRAA